MPLLIKKVKKLPAAFDAGHTTHTEECQEMIARFIRDDRGQDLIEYALLGSFVAIVALVGATNLGTQLNAWYDAMATWVEGAAGGIP
jgi:pilus assembly protein Flp/PilA